MLSGNAQNAIIGWEAHGPRIITARFKTNKNCKSVWTYPIQVSLRAPTNDSKAEDKEDFYNRLRSVVQMCPGGNMVIPMVIWKIQQIRETSRN